MIDRLEDLLDAGTRIPMSNKIAIDTDAFLNIVDQMRITIPQEIRQAREVQEERDKYIAQAHEEARRILSQAREDAAKQLDEHELRAAAHEAAQAIVMQAHAEADSIRQGADDYAEGQLKAMAQQLEQLLRLVQNGVQAIESRRTRELQRSGERPQGDEGQGSSAAPGQGTRSGRSSRSATVRPSPQLGKS